MHLLFSILLVFFTVACAPTALGPDKKIDPTQFDSKFCLSKEIFRVHCVSCHASSKSMSELPLVENEDIQKIIDEAIESTESDFLIIQPGVALESELYHQVKEGFMPPEEKLDSELVDALQKWIDEGAAVEDCNA